MIADVIVESPLNIYVGVMLTLSLNISGKNWKLREVYDVNIDKNTTVLLGIDDTHID